VTLERTGARIAYTAKSGRRRVHLVRDRDAIEVIRALSERPDGGRELLGYRSEEGWRDVRSSDINAYLQDHLGTGFSAKDFRTWQATVLAAALAGAEPVPVTAAARNRRMRSIVGEVADHLGNTPAVCRASYIDPRVFERFREGITISGQLAEISSGEGSAG
jgi:DNA topoisomerase IB